MIGTVVEIIVGIIVVLLIIAAINTMIENPKDIFIKLPKGFLKHVTGWYLIEELVQTKKEPIDTEYEIENKIKIDFKNTTKKLIIFNYNQDNLFDKLKEWLKTISENAPDCKIIMKNGNTIIDFQNKISFYNYNYLLQCIDNEKLVCAGYVKNKQNEFVVYQDRKTLNNIIGETNKRKKISVSLSNGFEDETYLAENSSIELDKERRLSKIRKLINE